MKLFDPKELNKLYRPLAISSKTDNGQVAIIGGSSLFHGAPILALKTASRIVDMVFFASPEPSLEKVAEQMKAQLSSFIWISWEHLDDYLEKSDAILIGPGLMRYHKDGKAACDEACQQTRMITEKLLKKWSKKQWVIDAGSLATMAPDWIPRDAILTPNRKEFEILFGTNEGNEGFEEKVWEMAKKYHCIIVYKAPETIICSPEKCAAVKGGNAGLTKGGTGDVLAGLTVALAAQNPPFLAACAASWITKKAADKLYQKIGFVYNADDLVEKIPQILGEYFR